MNPKVYGYLILIFAIVILAASLRVDNAGLIVVGLALVPVGLLVTAKAGGKGGKDAG